MKLSLTDKEKKSFKDVDKLTLERKLYLPAPASSILHGIGGKELFDKIAYKWVYGDTDDYISKNKGIGRRGTEYIYGNTKDRNIVNGGCWYEFNRSVNPYSPIGQTIQSGKKYIIEFKINQLIISELRSRDLSEYLDIILAITLQKIT